MTPKQERKYLEIKKRKRALVLGIESIEPTLDFNQKIYNALTEGKLTKEGLQQMCLAEGKKYSTMTSMINGMLTDAGEERTMTQFFKDRKRDNEKDSKKEINELLPDF